MVKGSKHSIEAKKKMSEVQKGERHHFFGRKFSEEHKRKMSNSKKGEKNPMYGMSGEKAPIYGKHHSKKTKRKQSESMQEFYGTEAGLKRKKEISKISRNPSKEARRKMSEANKAKKLTAEHKRKLTEVKKGRKLSEEHKKKIGEAGKGREFSEEHKRKIGEANKGNTHWKGKKHTKETILKMGEASKRKFLDPVFLEKYKKCFSLKPNKPEKLLISLLSKILPNEYKYVGDWSFVINGKNPDFMNINGEKKLIEVFGEYWHYTKLKKKNPELTKRYVEQKRISHFKPYGFQTLIIWEFELKNPEKLTKKLLEFDKA